MARKETAQERASRLLDNPFAGLSKDDAVLAPYIAKEQARIKARKEQEEREKKEWERMQRAEGKPLAPDSPFRTESAWTDVETSSSSTEAPRGTRSLDAVEAPRRVVTPTGDLNAIGLGIGAHRANVALDKEGEELALIKDLDTPEKRESYRLKLLAGKPAAFADPMEAQDYQSELIKGLERISEAERLAKIPGGYAQKWQEFDTKKKAIELQSKATDQYFDKTGSWAARAVSDTFGQYEQISSFVGGMVAGPGGAMLGSIPSINVARRAALVDAVRQGVPLETAQRNSYAMGASEAFFEIAGGVVASKFGLDKIAKSALDRVVATSVGKAAARTAGATTTSSVEEVATQLFQDTAQQSYRTFVLGEDNADPFSKYLKGQVPRKPDGSLDSDAYMGTLRRVAAAGALGGAVISAPINAGIASKENKDLLVDAAGRGLDRTYGQQTGDAAPSTAIDPRPSQDMFGTPEGLPSKEAYDAASREDNEAAALAQIERQRAGAVSTAEERIVSEQRAREREIAYAQREIAEIKKNSTAYTLGQDRDRILELEGKIGELSQPVTQAAAATPSTVIPQTTPVQEQMFVPDNTELVAEAEAEAAAAAKTVEKFEKGQVKSAKDKRTSARRAQERSVMLGLDPALPAPQKVQAVAEAMRTWDEANPIENYQTEVRDAAVKTEQKKAGKPKATTTATPTVRATVATPASQADLVDEAPKHKAEDVLGPLIERNKKLNETLSMVGPEQVRDPANQEDDRDVISSVFEELKKKVNTEKGAVLLRLMAAGKVQIVKNLPDNQAGMYDGETTYISAERVLQNGSIAAVLDVAGHEIKHGVDVSGARATLDETTNNSIIAGLRQAATRGDEDAIRAWAAATGQDASTPSKVKLGIPSDKTARLELAARGVNYANAKAQSQGRLESIGRGVISAVRTNFKKATGQSADVNMDDLGYLAQKMMKDVALKDVSIKGDVAAATGRDDNLSMFAGLQARTADMDSLATADAIINDEQGRLTPEEGRRLTGWFKDTDGKMKFEFSDDGAAVLPEYNALPTQLQDNTGSLLVKVFKHDKLYAAYPWIRNLRITRKPYPFRPNVLGDANYNAKTINIAPKVDDPTSIILHEVQHMIQAYENWARGGSQNNVLGQMSPKQKLSQVPKLLEPLRVKANEEASMFYIYDKLSRLPTSILKDYRTLVDQKEVLWNDLETKKEMFGDDSIEAAEARQRWYNADDKRNEEFMKLRTRVFGGEASMKEYSNLANATRDYNQIPAFREIWRDKTMASQDLISKLEAGDLKAIDAAAKETESLHKFYFRLGGEVQSRMTQARQKLTEQQRRDTPLDETRKDKTVNVAKEDEIIILSDGTQLSEGGNKKTLSMVGPTLADTKPSKSDKDWSVRSMRVLKRLLASYEGHEADLVKAGTAGKGESSALSYEAEYLAKTVNLNIKAAMSSTGRSREEVMKEVDEAITFSNENGGSENQRARMIKERLDAAFPAANLGDGFNKLRAFKWQMSQSLVQMRLKDTRLMTDKERATYTKIMTDAETWTTRAYMNDLDKSYAKRFLKNAGVDPTSEDGKKLEAGVNWLTNNWLLIPDNEDLQTTPLGNLTRMLENWDSREAKNLKNVKDTDERRELMIEKLEEIREKGGDYSRQKALTIITDMLTNKGAGTFVGRSARGMKQNRTVLEARAGLPVELRDVMGEITDPFLREAISLARLTGLVGQTKALTQIYGEGEGKFYSTTQEGNFQYKLSEAAFGPLQGMYVNQDTKDFLGSYVATLAQYDTTMQEALSTPMGLPMLAVQRVGMGISKVASQAKISGVVMSMGKMGLNLAGAASYAVVNGVHPKFYGPAFQAAMAVSLGNVGRIRNPKVRALAEEILRVQAVDSAAVQEMRGGPWQMIEGEVDRIAGKGIINSIWKNKTRPQEAVAEVYAAMDVWTKVATYMQNRETLTEYNRLENKGWTEEQIAQESGLRANRTNISYAAAIPLVRMAEKFVPFFTAFATYKTEVVRSTAMMAVDIRQDIKMANEAKTPEGKRLMKNRAIDKFFGTIIATVLPVLANLDQIDDETEDEALRREALAEWDRNRMLAYIGKGANGVEHFFSISRIDAKGVVNDAIVDVVKAMEKDDGLETLGKVSWDLFTGEFSRFMGAQTLLNDIAAAVPMEDNPFKDKKDPKSMITGTKLEEQIKTYLGLGADVGVNATRLMQDLFMPDQIVVMSDDKVLDIKEGKKVGGTVLKYLGLKGSTADPQRMMQSAGWDYQNEVKKLKEKSAKIIKSPGDPTDKMEDLVDLVDKEQKAFIKLRNKVRAFQAFDGPDFVKGEAQTKSRRTFAQAVEILKADSSGGVSAKDTNNLQTSVFRSTILTPKLIQTYEKDLMKKLDDNSPNYKAELEDIKNRVALMEQAYTEQSKESK